MNKYLRPITKNYQNKEQHSNHISLNQNFQYPPTVIQNPSQSTTAAQMFSQSGIAVQNFQHSITAAQNSQPNTTKQNFQHDTPVQRH